jgi:fatty acid desaturase
MTLPAGPPSTGSDYAELLGQVRRAGLMERSGRRYARRILAMAALVVLGAVAFVAIGDSWWTLAIAAFAGVVSAQLGFLGHDAAHQQIFTNRRSNARLGFFVSNLGIGLSYSWWIDKHNRHHRYPNQVGRDPDIDRNILAWTPQQAAAQQGAFAVIARHQALVFFPLLLLEAFNLQVGSVRALWSSTGPRRLELWLLALHLVGEIVVLLVVLSPLRALVFFLVLHMVFGLYLGSSFAPNHKGMAILDDGVEMDFVRRQVITSRNVVGGRLLTAALGGLNFQIEHHLFPCMPMRNLRACRVITRRFCEERAISYCEASLFDSYGQAMRYLRGLRPSATAA